MNIKETLRKAFEAVKDFSKPTYSQYKPEPEVMPFMEAKGYELKRDMWSPYAIGIPVELYIMCDANGKHISALSPKADRDALKEAYEQSKIEAGLTPTQNDDKPAGPAPK